MKPNLETTNMLDNLQSNTENYLTNILKVSSNYAALVEDSAITLIEQTPNLINNIKSESINVDFQIHNALTQFANQIKSIPTYVVDLDNDISNQTIRAIDSDKQIDLDVIEDTASHLFVAKESATEFTNQTFDLKIDTITAFKHWVNNSKETAINWIRFNGNKFAEKYLTIEEGMDKFHTDIGHLKSIFKFLAEKTIHNIHSSKNYVVELTNQIASKGTGFISKTKQFSSDSYDTVADKASYLFETGKDYFNTAKNFTANLLSQSINKGFELGNGIKDWTVETKDALSGYASEYKDDAKQFASNSYNTVADKAAYLFETGKGYFNKLASNLSFEQPIGLVESQIKADFTDPSEANKPHERAGTKVLSEEVANTFASTASPANETVNFDSKIFVSNFNQFASLYGSRTKLCFDKSTANESIVNESIANEIQLANHNLSYSDFSSSGFNITSEPTKNYY